MSEPLEKVLRKIAEITHHIGYEDANEGHTEDLRNAAELIRVLGRLLAGKSVYEAFGAPGDWGYGTSIGDALLEVYRANDGSKILQHRT